MFQLLLAGFLIVNGVKAPEPALVIGNKAQFATEQLCLGYLDTPEGADSKQAALEIIAEMMKGRTYATAFACVKTKGTGEAI